MVELMIVIAIIGVLTAVGYPSIRATMQKYNFRAAAQEVLGTAMQARSNAIRENSSGKVTLGAADGSDPQHKYTLRNSSGAGIVTHDISSYGNGIKLIGGTENTCGNATSNWNGDPISQAAELSFTARGFGTAGSFFIEDEKNDICFAVSATSNGVVRVRRYNGAATYSNSNWY